MPPLTKSLTAIALFVAAASNAANPESWLAPHAPQKIYGNTYYVGSEGLSSILVTSEKGHVLIDGALPESAPLIRANIETLGFRVQDIQLILNSHVHYDHAGGIAQLQAWSGAPVAALAPSADVLKQGFSDSNDPQYGELPPIGVVKSVRVVDDNETVRVGELALTAHATPGHTPGGTTWTWKSCEGARCLNMVYADSLSAVSAKTFKFSNNSTYPDVLADFEKSFRLIAKLPCDVLITPHPQISDLFARLQSGIASDPDACRRFTETAKKNLEARVAAERNP